MTRLTKSMRDNIMSNIMADVPVKNYRDILSEFLNKSCLTLLPPEIQAFHGTPAWRFISVQQVWFDGIGHISVAGLPESSWSSFAHNNPDPIWKALSNILDTEGIFEQFKVYTKQRLEMRDKLKHLLASASSVKKLREVLAPDLHDYIPEDDEIVTANLPVPAIVEELKAMGFPQKAAA